VSKITESARGESCTMRLDNCFGGPDNETVVFAHKNGGRSGMGQKYLDEDGKDVGFYSCGYCHATYDAQMPHPYYKKVFLNEMAEFAIRETDKKLKKKGLKT
jgi:hypothetical protein